ncbi:MAG: hypothetical protein MUE72_13125, partial [Chitinophagaceae bacterium]|nr:hypothetical protein [Chitinophagaceae bacterium]
MDEITKQQKIASIVMIHEKTNQDFNNHKPNASDEGFKEPIKDPNESDTSNDGMDSLDKENSIEKTNENTLSTDDKNREAFLLNEEEAQQA